MQTNCFMITGTELISPSAKMEDMERELQCLRQQMATTANGKRPHPQCNTQQILSKGTKRNH